MSQLVIDSKVIKGRIELNNLPFEDDQEVKVYVIPKFKLDLDSFVQAQKLTASIKGNLSDDIVAERNER